MYGAVWYGMGRWQLMSLSLLSSIMECLTSSSLSSLTCTCRRWCAISRRTLTGWRNAWYWYNRDITGDANMMNDFSGQTLTQRPPGAKQLTEAVSLQFGTRLASVQRVDLSYCPKPDVPLTQFASVTHLRVCRNTYNHVADLKWVSQLPLLQQLNFCPTYDTLQPLTGCDSLLQLRHLRHLDIADPYTFGVTIPLANVITELVTLKFLRMGSWPAHTPLTLQKLTRLQYLYVHGFTYDGLVSKGGSPPMILPTSLRHFFCPSSMTPISALSPLANVTSLELLNIGSSSHESISDPLLLRPLHLLSLLQCKRLHTVRFHDLVDFTTIPTLGQLPLLRSLRLATRQPWRYPSELSIAHIT
jgi:hypothetical protein